MRVWYAIARYKMSAKRKPRVAQEEPKEVTMKAAVKAAVKPRKNKHVVLVSDITTFFQHSSRDKNDATNKVRERVLECMCSPPAAFLEDETHGPAWQQVHREWNASLATLVNLPYTSTSIIMKGGRGFHYDAEVSFYHEREQVATRKIEFKYGGTNIDALPQFLSLQAKFELFAETYDTFWYEHYLDAYLACDAELTVAKPSLDAYLKCVTKTTYSVSPFFEKLKERELMFQAEKDAVVNQSITDYLTKHGEGINLALFSEKVQSTQREKSYLLWSNGAFHVDSLSEPEMINMSYHAIRNGNVLEVKSGNTVYSLLLRWRNHKGILNPAWQISMKR